MSLPVDLRALPPALYQEVFTPENVRVRPVANSLSSLSFPKSRCALWDGTPTGDDLLLHLCVHRAPQVQLTERALRLAQRHQRHSSRTLLRCFLLGSVCVDSDEEGVTVTLDRFDPGRDQNGTSVPSALLPGDVCASCVFTSDPSALIQSEAELQQAFKTLQQCISGRQSLDMCQILRLGLHVVWTQGLDSADFSLTWTCVSPSTSVHVEPVRAVHVIPTALLRSLTSPARPSAPYRQKGYVTMDQSRKLLLLLESDPKALSLPLVGVWFSGVTQVHSPQVWAWTLRFLYSSCIQDRVLSESRKFLLLLFASTHRAPQFFQCKVDGPGLGFQLLTGHHTATLYQVASVEGQTLGCDLGTESSSAQAAVFTQAHRAFSSSPALVLSVTDQDSGVEDEDLSPRPSPSPHVPSVQQARMIQPSVPELSLLVDDSFSSNHNAPKPPPPATDRNTAYPPRHNLHSTPYSDLPSGCACCENKDYQCTSIHPTSNQQTQMTDQRSPALNVHQTQARKSSSQFLFQKLQLNGQLSPTGQSVNPTHSGNHHSLTNQLRKAEPNYQQSPEFVQKAQQAQSSIHSNRLQKGQISYPSLQVQHLKQSKHCLPSGQLKTPANLMRTGSKSLPTSPTDSPIGLFPNSSPLHQLPANTQTPTSTPVSHPSLQNFHPSQFNPNQQTSCSFQPKTPQPNPVSNLFHTPQNNPSCNDGGTMEAPLSQTLPNPNPGTRQSNTVGTCFARGMEAPPPLPASCSGRCCEQQVALSSTEAYQLLLQQDRQLRLLQQQVQMLLEAQGKPQSTQHQTQTQIKSTTSIAVGTGASLFWPEPPPLRRDSSTSPPPVEGAVSLPQSIATPPSKRGSCDQNELRAERSRTPASPAASRNGLSAVESPVLGESASMYQPQEDHQSSFYHNLMTQLNSRLREEGQTELEDQTEPEDRTKPEEKETKQEMERGSPVRSSLSSAPGWVQTQAQSPAHQVSAPVSVLDQSRVSTQESAQVSAPDSAPVLSPVSAPVSGSKQQKKKSPRAAEGEDAVMSATMRRLQQLGVKLDQRDLSESARERTTTVDSASTLACINPDALVSRLTSSRHTSSLSSLPRSSSSSVDLSLEANAIALRYLSDRQLTRLTLPHPQTASPSQPDLTLLSPSNMSLATRKYMRRYGLIEEAEEEEEEEEEERRPFCEPLPPQSQLIRQLKPKMQLLNRPKGGASEEDKENTPRRRNMEENHGSVGNILDLSRLRQLPKLF